MKSFFSRLHDTQTGHSKSASRETYKFWIPNPNTGRNSPKPNPVPESAAPVPTTRPQAEKRSSSRAHKHSYPIPVASHDKPAPPSNTTTTAPAIHQPTFAATTHTVPSFQHASSTLPQPVSNVTSTRYHESIDDKPQSPPPPAARPSYSTRTWTQQQMPTKSAPQASSSRIGPTSVQHEIWLPTNIPSTSKPIEESTKVEERTYTVENSRPHNDDKDRPLESGKRERERERTRERERDRRRERDGDRERVRPPTREQVQENTRERERTRTRDRERDRELAKEAEREQVKERAYRERERDREPERQRERDRERQKERARDKEREQQERERDQREREQREKVREQERDKEREREPRDRDRERERRDRERARYYEREKRDIEKEREREKHRPREHDRDREKDRGRDNNATRESPSIKLKDSVAEEGLVARDDPRRTVQPERVKADIVSQDPDLRREKDGRSARDHHRSRKRDGEQRYRAEATDGEQNLRRAKPRTLQPERKEDRQGWVSDTFATHERKTSRQTVAREQPAIDEGEISDNSIQVRITTRARPRYGQVDGNDAATKDQVPLNTATALQASNHSLSKAPPAIPDSNPPISATPLQMPVHLPSKDSRTTDRPGHFLANEQTANESTVPIRREINRLKLNSRQEDGRPSHPEPLPKVVDPPSGQQRPPSRAYPAVIPQYLSTSQSASSQPLRSAPEVTQTPVGSNQLLSTVSRSTTVQIPEPRKGTEQTEGRPGAKKEQHLPTAGSTSKVDLRSDAVRKVGSQNGPSVATNPALQIPDPFRPSLAPVTSQRLDSSPKSRRGPNIAAPTTGMEQEPSNTRHLSLVQTKETSKNDSHSVTVKSEQPNFPFSPPPSVPLVNRYPAVGRRELYASPAPVTVNIQDSQVVGTSIEDTRPASRAQRLLPLMESQSNKSSQAPVVSHVHSGPYSHHLPAFSQDVGQITTASYAREAVPQASPIPNRDKQAKTATTTTTHMTSDQNGSDATGQNRIENSIPVSDRHLLASPSIGVGMNTSGARLDLPGTTVQEKLTTSISQFPARIASGTRNSNIILQHDPPPISGPKSSSRDLQPSGLSQPTNDRVPYEATAASLLSSQIAQQSSTSLRIKVSGSQLRSQDAESPSMPTSSGTSPVVVPAIKHESSAPPPAKSTVLDHGSFLPQPAAYEQVVESPLSRPQLSSIDPSSLLSRQPQPRLTAHSEQPHPIIEKATTLFDPQRSMNNGPKAGSYNVLHDPAVNSNIMTERPTALEDQSPNNAPAGRMNIFNEHTSLNSLSNRADSRPSNAAVSRADSSVPAGSLPVRTFTTSLIAPRQEKEALPLRSENSAEASLTPRLLASSSFKKESPKNPVNVIHTSSNLSKEAVTLHAVTFVRKEESPKARHPEVAGLQTTNPSSDDLTYGPTKGMKQNGPEIPREGRSKYSPKVTGSLKVENATVPPEHLALRREPSGVQLDRRSNYVPPNFPVLDQYRPSKSTSNAQLVSDSQLQQTLTPYPLRHEQVAFVHDSSRAALSPRLATSPSDHPLLPTFSIKSGNVPGAKVPSSPRTAREETTFPVEETDQTPERHFGRKGVVNEEEEDRMSKPLVHDRQPIIRKPSFSHPPPPASQKQVFTEHSVGKETPSLGFFTTNFSTALSASAEPKVVEEEPTANMAGIEQGISNSDGAGKAKTEVASSHDLRAVSQHKNAATGEFPSESLPNTGPSTKKDGGANYTPTVPVAPAYKISHPVLAEILSSPKPTKEISIPSVSTMLQSTSMNDRPSVSSNVKAEQPTFDNPMSDTQRTNIEASRTQAPPKYPYSSQPGHIPGPTQLPPQDAPSVQDHRTASNSNLADFQQSRPMPQVMNSQPPSQNPLVAPSTRTLSSSNQPFSSAHPSLLKHGDLLTVAPSPRPEGGRIGTTAQMTLPHDRKTSAATTSSNPTPKENRWIPSEGYHYSSKVPAQYSRAPAGFHMPVPPQTNMTSNQAARHQHSASLPTSLPLAPTTNPPQKDDPSRTRSPVYQQPHYVPYQTNLIRVNPSGEKTAVALPKAPSEETILMTPSSLAQSTMLKPTTSRQSVTPSMSSQTAKKGGIFDMFRKATPQPSTQTPQQYEIWHPNLAAKTPDSSPGQQKPANAHSAIQGTPSTPTKVQTADEFAISVPIHGGDQHQKAARVFTPFRYLTSKKNRAVSVASMEAQDGTAANTVVGSPTASMHSQSVIIPPPLRDPRLATEEWRDKEEAEAEVRAKNKLRRQRPGVVFDVDGDVLEDTQKRPRRRGTRYRKTGKDDDPLSS